MAWTCSYCGYNNSDNDAACIVCGDGRSGGAGSAGEQTPDSGSTRPPTSAVPPGNARTYPQTDRGGNRGTPLPPPAGRPGVMLRGRVSRIDRTEEQPEKTPAEYLAKFLIGILILVPFLALFTASGLLAVSFGIVGFPSIAHLLNPFSWTTALAELLEVLVLSRLRGGQNLPVYRGTIQAEGGNQRSFMMIGPFRDGDFTVGDTVELYGSERSRAFRVERAQNCTTGSMVTSQYRNRWPFVLRIVAFIYALIGGYAAWFYFSGN